MSKIVLPIAREPGAAPGIEGDGARLGRLRAGIRAGESCFDNTKNPDHAHPPFSSGTNAPAMRARHYDHGVEAAHTGLGIPAESLLRTPADA